MNIPAHRAAAVAPTPAHSFELCEGELVNRIEESSKPAEPAEPAATAPPASPAKPGRTAPPVSTAPSVLAE